MSITHIHHTDEDILLLSIDGETIETTAEHPFYTEEGVWINAAELEAGDYIQSFDADQCMYTLTVDDAHTFYVGESLWLVHNCNITQVNHDAKVIAARKTHGLGNFDPHSRNVGVADFHDADDNLVRSATGISGWHSPGNNPFSGTVDLLSTNQRRFDTLMHTQA